MKERLEIKVDGIEIGRLQISGTNNSLEISGNLLSDGRYSFTVEEIKKLVENKMKRNYPGKKIEINEYPSNVEFAETAEKYPDANFIRRDQD